MTARPKQPRMTPRLTRIEARHCPEYVPVNLFERLAVVTGFVQRWNLALLSSLRAGTRPCPERGHRHRRCARARGAGAGGIGSVRHPQARRRRHCGCCHYPSPAPLVAGAQTRRARARARGSNHEDQPRIGLSRSTARPASVPPSMCSQSREVSPRKSSARIA